MGSSKDFLHVLPPRFTVDRTLVVIGIKIYRYLLTYVPAACDLMRFSCSSLKGEQKMNANQDKFFD